MIASTTLRVLAFDDALMEIGEGAAFIDLRPTGDYLDVHISGSLGLLYEFGPGMAQRARDCIPLEVPLALLDTGHGDVTHAAASLRGKGFRVVGALSDAINRWAEERQALASTEVATGESMPRGTILDVKDPGCARAASDVTIPIERLWWRASELRAHKRVVVIAGYGVRAALAVGILERAGVEDVVFWRTRG